MSTRVRSYSKINLGLAIGPVRADGFHELTTVYQTLALHDVVKVRARRVSGASRLSITTNHPFVPRDGRNTAWKMVERALEEMGVSAEVEIDIDKRLPVQGGMGAGSANAAAALIGLERELGIRLAEEERLRVAAEVGSDVPLFLLGGAVLGTGRGEHVVGVPDLPRLACVIAVPGVGVSTPQAFRDWDALVARKQARGLSEPDPQGPGLTFAHPPRTLSELSYAYASCLAGSAEPGTSGIHRDPSSEKKHSEKKQNGPEAKGESLGDLAEETLLALVRTGIENDFEQVVFLQYPSLREIKRQLMGSDSDSASAEPALYAALSGSGSALFGLYRSEAGAKAAQQRVHATGVEAILTETLPREPYWTRMFAG